MVNQPSNEKNYMQIKQHFEQSMYSKILIHMSNSNIEKRLRL